MPKYACYKHQNGDFLPFSGITFPFKKCTMLHLNLFGALNYAFKWKIKQSIQWTPDKLENVKKN